MLLVLWGRLRLDIELCVYGTVVLMTVLVVALDDGVGDFVDAVQVVVGPLIATFAAHLFAGVLAQMNASHVMPSGAEVRHLAAQEAQFLMLGIVPVAILVFGAVTDLYTADQAVGAMLWLGLVFLVILGGLGGYRTSRSWWVTLLVALAAGLLGVFVLLLRVVLEH